MGSYQGPAQRKTNVYNGNHKNLLKLDINMLLHSALYQSQLFSTIMGYAFILKSFTYTYLYNIIATPDGFVQFHDRNYAMILVSQSNKRAASQ